MFKNLILIFVSITSGLSCLSLTEALNRSQICFPELLIEEAELDARLARVEQAYSGWKPRLDLNFTTGAQRVQGLIASQFDRGNPRYPKTASVTLSQNLFSFGQTQAQINYNKLLVCAQQSTIEARRQQLFLEVSTAYINAFEAKEIIRVREHYMNTLAAHLDAIRVRRDLSDATQTDVDQTLSRYHLAKADLQYAMSVYWNALADLSYWTGLQVIDGLEHPPKLPNLPETVDLFAATVLEASPLIIQAEHEYQALKYQEKAIRAQSLPKVDIEGSLAHQSDTSFRGSESDQLTAQLVFSYPLYQGGSIKNQIKENRSLQSAASLKLTLIYNQLRRDSYQHWNDMQALDLREESLKIAYEAINSAYEGVVKEQKFGERVYLDVLDSAQEKLDAEELLITALNQKFIKRAEMLSLSNQLDPSCLEEQVIPILNTLSD